MVDKIGLFRRLFTRKNKETGKTQETTNNNGVVKSNGLNGTGKVTLNTVWEGTQPTGSQYQAFTVETNSYKSNAIAQLATKFEDIPEKALRNKHQDNIDPDSISENDPNYISDMAQGFEDREFCEV